MNPGDRVRVDHPDGHEEGTLMPSTTADHLVVKLAGGYNVGVARADADVEVVERAAREVDATEAPEEGAATSVALVSTGGTIASTVDYRTGAVTARFDAEDVLRAVPELAGRANYRGRVVANILSENMTPAVWQTLAETVYEEVAGGADGIVVMHGTDTMAHSATAMSLMLDVPVPVVFTGSQRSADRPSSDNVMNAVCAVEAATADHAETLVCMHAGLSDDTCALHRGARVRKNHTSRRDAFETVGARPLGSVDYETGTVTFRRDHTPRGDDVALFKFAPGTGVEALDRLAGHAGVVIEGTGLGHVSTELIPRVEELVESGTVVAMTSQCLEGRVCDRVYDTGRDLLDAGVVEADDTLPSAAYVKLMWVLANADDPRAAMQRDLAGELQARSVPWT